MELYSKRLKFREFQPDDFDLFSSVFSNEMIMEYSYMDQITDENDMFSYFKNVIENNSTTQNRKSYEFAVFLSTENKFIGFADIRIEYHQSREKYGEIGYFLLPHRWGNGYATEIAKLLISVCFKDLDLFKVVASCNANNHRSEKVMQNAGMVKEGEFRKERYKNGKWDNELRYSILVEEWHNRKGKEK